MHYVWPILECFEARRISLNGEMRAGPEPRFYPHEFLFLLCNCENTLDMIDTVMTDHERQ